MKRVKIGWIHRARIGDVVSCWANGHDEARRNAVAELGPSVETEVADGVGRDEGFSAAARDFAERGFDLVYACDTRGGMKVFPIADEFPETRFEHNQGRVLAANVGTYYEARDEHAYVSGLLCGAMTKTGVLGYVGGRVGPLDVQIANAWAIGVREAHPDAAILARWVGDYFAPNQPELEEGAMDELIGLGADVFGGTLTENPTMTRVAAERGVYCMGRDPRSLVHASVLDVAYVDWTPYYIADIRSVQDGSWRARHVCLHYRDGVVRNTAPAAVVPADAAARAIRAAEQLRDGSLDIWRGPIRDNSGRMVVPEGKGLADVYDGPAPEPDLTAADAYLASDQVCWLHESIEATIDPEQEWSPWGVPTVA